MNTTTNEAYKPKQYRLREMPKDVHQILLSEQATQKSKCNCQFSLEQTMYMLIRKAKKSDQTIMT